mmetsp:Transcript_13820/g.34817  ORF Transcript_13820/g.34817 Transcript_13820/m.34817 type:complete len:245 (+) Transcript_13820:206-940(+)
MERAVVHASHGPHVRLGHCAVLFHEPSVQVLGRNCSERCSWGDGLSELCTDTRRGRIQPSMACAGHNSRGYFHSEESELPRQLRGYEVLWVVGTRCEEDSSLHWHHDSARRGRGLRCWGCLFWAQRLSQRACALIRHWGAQHPRRDGLGHCDGGSKCQANPFNTLGYLLILAPASPGCASLHVCEGVHDTLSLLQRVCRWMHAVDIVVRDCPRFTRQRFGRNDGDGDVLLRSNIQGDPVFVGVA